MKFQPHQHSSSGLKSLSLTTHCLENAISGGERKKFCDLDYHPCFTQHTVPLLQKIRNSRQINISKDKRYGKSNTQIQYTARFLMHKFKKGGVYKVVIYVVLTSKIV